MKSKPNPGGSNLVVGQKSNRSDKSGMTKNESYGTGGSNRSGSYAGHGGRK